MRNLQVEIDQTLAVVTTLEQYCTLLKQGSVSKTTSNIIAIGMQQIDKLIPTSLVTSVEEYEYHGSNHTSEITFNLEDFRDRLVEAKDYLIKLWKKFINWLSDEISSTLMGLNSLERKAARLEITLKGLESKANRLPRGAITLTIPAASRLANRIAIDGNFPYRNLELCIETIGGTRIFLSEHVREAKSNTLRKLNAALGEYSRTEEVDLELLKTQLRNNNIRTQLIKSIENTVLPGNHRLIIVSENDWSQQVKFIKDETIEGPTVDLEINNFTLRAAFRLFEQVKDDISNVKNTFEVVRGFDGDLKKLMSSSDRLAKLNPNSKELTSFVFEVASKQSLSVYDNMKTIVRFYSDMVSIFELYSEEFQRVTK